MARPLSQVQSAFARYAFRDGSMIADWVDRGMLLLPMPSGTTMCGRVAGHLGDKAVVWLQKPCL